MRKPPQTISMSSSPITWLASEVSTEILMLRSLATVGPSSPRVLNVYSGLLLSRLAVTRASIAPVKAIIEKCSSRRKATWRVG
ncbi:hypothetical protein D9M68_937600 [compost metagenome]